MAVATKVVQLRSVMFVLLSALAGPSVHASEGQCQSAFENLAYESDGRAYTGKALERALYDAINEYHRLKSDTRAIKGDQDSALNWYLTLAHRQIEQDGYSAKLATAPLPTPNNPNATIAVLEILDGPEGSIAARLIRLLRKKYKGHVVIAPDAFDPKSISTGGYLRFARTVYLPVYAAMRIDANLNSFRSIFAHELTHAMHHYRDDQGISSPYEIVINAAQRVASSDPGYAAQFSLEELYNYARDVKKLRQAKQFYFAKGSATHLKSLAQDASDSIGKLLEQLKDPKQENAVQFVADTISGLPIAKIDLYTTEPKRNLIWWMPSTTSEPVHAQTFAVSMSGFKGNIGSQTEKLSYVIEILTSAHQVAQKHLDEANRALQELGPNPWNQAQ